MIWVSETRSNSVESTSGVIREVVARFMYPPDRERVWESKSNLKGTNIIVKEDLPEKFEQERKVLTPIYNHPRFIGQKAKLVKDSAIIEGRSSQKSCSLEIYVKENLHMKEKNMFCCREGYTFQQLVPVAFHD